ncbi:hypothetical protein NJH54_12545 [Pseudomonas asiatica]|nr:hypothetical protein [Pseudomonas asiatica]MCO7525343.1 hypothetical protein [Pseudomonas asiatica]
MAHLSGWEVFLDHPSPAPGGFDVYQLNHWADKRQRPLGENLMLVKALGR